MALIPQINHVFLSWVSLVHMLVTQLCLTLCDPMDCSPPGSSVHGILLARILEWVAIPCSRGSSPPRNGTWVSCIAGRRFTVWDTREALYSSYTQIQSYVPALSQLTWAWLIGDFHFCFPALYKTLMCCLIVAHLHNNYLSWVSYCRKHCV